VWALLDAKFAADSPVARHAARAGAGTLIAIALAVVVIEALGAGPAPPSRIRQELKTITQTYAPLATGQSRLDEGLGSGRWDFWRVAWMQFSAHPVLGAGADNYRQAI